MERKISQAEAEDNAIYATILADWLQATSTFYSYYRQLTPYINQEEQQGLPTDKRINKSQCPVDQLRMLFSKMNHEVEKLLQNLELVKTLNQGNSRQKYKMLAAHARILNQLNKELQIMSLLTTQTAS